MNGNDWNVCVGSLMRSVTLTYLIHGHGRVIAFLRNTGMSKLLKLLRRLMMLRRSYMDCELFSACFHLVLFGQVGRGG